ncbi:amidohydrolase [Bacillus sp. FJAT-27245]|uniref:amidohydrolase n=1 Tax=Bacillus sp. FJAT-27245 TaxID=1684144 RepID=UPI0006A7BA3D|nr:amidohydrolase [Bacillus sp. FJAT-27245]
MATLWHGGPIYTLAEEGEKVEAVLTENGRIIGAGKLIDLEAGPDSPIHKRIDLRGCTMIPGLVDSHIHLIGHGERLIRLDLSGYRTRKETLAAVKEYSMGLKPGEWVIGEGWNENLWEMGEPLTKGELDQLVPDRPVLLKRICRHACVANSVALEAAGVDETSMSPPGGLIEKSPSGQLTGILKDSAQELVYSILPEASESYLIRAIKASIKDLYSLGITGVHTEDLNYYGGFEKTYGVFKRAIKEDGLKFRAHLLVHHGVLDDFISHGHTYLDGDEWIEFGAMKIFSDGALGGRTALLSEPYSDTPETSGVAIFSKEELAELVGKARENQLPVAIHAIGDLAFEYCLDALEANPLRGRGRDRLIHAQILRKDLIERAKTLPLVLDLQPVFMLSDYPWVIDRVGEERMRYSYAWKTLLDSGIPCSGGSDAPIEYPNPFHGIAAAVNRTVNGKAYGIGEALSTFEAVSLFTKGSAYAAFHESDRGMIREGMLADFTILDRDIFSVPKETIHEIKAAMTVIGEEIVFKGAQP